MSKVLPLLLLAGLTLAACDKPAAPPAPAAPPPAPAPAAPAAPADQTALVAVIAADNCDGFRQTAGFDAWQVTVDDVETSEVNKSIDVTFGAGQNIGLEQVVQTTDPLYAAIAALRQGGTTRISGRFTHGNGECSFKLDKVGIVLEKLG